MSPCTYYCTTIILIYLRYCKLSAKIELLDPGVLARNTLLIIIRIGYSVQGIRLSY